MKKTIITIFLLLLFFIGCNNNYNYKEKKIIENEKTQITKETDKISKESGQVSEKLLSEIEKNLINKKVSISSQKTELINFPKAPSEKLSSLFDQEMYVSSNAECPLSCLEKLLFFANEDYATDGENIYINVYDGGSSWQINYQHAKNIDSSTFQLLGLNYFKDKNGVYFNTFLTSENLDDNIKFLKNIDSETIQIVSYHCIADKNGVYCDTPYDKIEKSIDMKKVFDVDRETFVTLGNAEVYFKDKSNVFCNKHQKGINIQKLDNVDAESFSIVTNSSFDEFGKDKNNVFLFCNKVEGVEDVDSFEITQGNNGKDKLFEYTIDDNGSITKKTSLK